MGLREPGWAQVFTPGLGVADGMGVPAPAGRPLWVGRPDIHPSRQGPRNFPPRCSPPESALNLLTQGWGWGSTRYLQIPSVPRLPSRGAPGVTPVCRWAGYVPRWSGYNPNPGSSEALVLGQSLGLPEAS